MNVEEAWKVDDLFSFSVQEARILDHSRRKSSLLFLFFSFLLVCFFNGKCVTRLPWYIISLGTSTIVRRRLISSAEQDAAAASSSKSTQSGYAKSSPSSSMRARPSFRGFSLVLVVSCFSSADAALLLLLVSVTVASSTEASSLDENEGGNVAMPAPGAGETKAPTPHDAR